MNHYPRHIGDWIRDTAHLSEVEECIYSRMIDQYYSREKPLPADPVAVCRLVRAGSKEARKAVQVVLAEFFEQSNEGWRQKRCDSELQRYAERSAKAAKSAAVRWGGSNSDGNANADANAFNEHVERIANQNQEPVTNKTLSTPTGVEVPGGENLPPGTSPSDRPKKAIPDCDHVGVVAAYHAALPMCPQVIEWNATRRGYLQARWREKGAALNWQSQADGVAYFTRYFDHVRESKFLTGRANGRPGQPPFIADLEWLVRPTNFAKVVEGKYHGA